jgi:hypothetical protein
MESIVLNFQVVTKMVNKIHVYVMKMQFNLLQTLNFQLHTGRISYNGLQLELVRLRALSTEY